MTRIFGLILGALLLGGSVGLAQDTPSIDVAQEADLHFRVAVERYREGDFEGALEHLLLSNRLVPNKNVVFNIARVYEQLEMYDQAFRHYHEYVTLETDPTSRAAGEESIERIRGRVALVLIASEPAGATIYVDRRDLGPRGVTPRTLALPPGPHLVLFDLDGHHGTEAETTVALGATVQVSATLDRVLGTVRLTGSPEGARVRLGSETGPVVGTLPGSISLTPGPHVLVIEADSYETLQRLVQVAPDDQADLSVDLPLLTGTVVVDAVERDALIEIDGRAAGFTPAVLDVPVGDHVVKVTRQGFRDFEEDVTVVQGSRTTVEVRLRSHQEVTAATRTTRAVEEAPASVSIISAEEIRTFGYQTVYEALAGTRGVYQTNDLSYEYLGFRGFSRPGDYGNRVLATLDGHAVNDDLLGASYVGNDLLTDLHDVRQIEVVRGPGSALYGTNAFFGVVNVVNTDGQSIPRPHVVVTADAYRTARGRLGGGFGTEDRGAFFSLGAFARQGYDYYFEEWDEGDGDGWSRGADGAVGGNFQAKAWFDDFRLNVFFNAHRKHVPTGAFETLLGDERTLNTDLRSFAELRWEPRFGERYQLYARAYTDFYEYWGDYPYEDTYVASDRWNGAWAGVEGRLVASATDWLEVTAGAEARFYYQAHLYSYDQVDGEEEAYLDEKPTQQVYAGYVLLEGRYADLLQVSIGARYDFFTLESTGGAFSPRAAFILSPGRRDVVKVVGGTAFRAPSPYEWFYNDDGFTQVTPEDLDAERIWTGEVEYTHRFGDVTHLTVASYFNHLPNLIETELTGEIGEGGGELFRYANTGDPISTVGFEYEIRRDWRRGVMVSFSHSLQQTREGSLFGGDAITNSPEQLLALKLAAPLVPGISTVATRLRAESPRLTPENTLTAWALIWDVTVTGELPIAPVRLGIGVRNLLDWQYGHPGGVELRMPEVPQAGRTLFATLEGHL